MYMINKQHAVQLRRTENCWQSVPKKKPASEQFNHDKTNVGNCTGLSNLLQARLEHLSGVDFSGVRVHRNSAEPSKLNALAYTQGKDIHVGPGQEKHLPHEAWHVAQQLQGRVNPTIRTKGLLINDDKSLEREADFMGAKSARAEPARPLLGDTVNSFQKPTRWASSLKSHPKALHQKSNHVIQRKPNPNTTLVKEDPVQSLGEILWRDFPAGVNLIFYDDTDAELIRRAKEVATREKAIAANKQNFSASDLEFGLAFPDSKFDIKTAIPKLTSELRKATDKAGKPADVTPLPGTGPAQVRKLTVFAHGSNTWCGISNGLTTGKAAVLIKKIAPSLTTDVNLVIYACSVGRGTDEDESWRRGTMQSGGSGSLASSIRDALIEENKLQSSVWGHTTVGHTTTNWALRVFEASLGEGSAGVSFAGERVFGVVENIIAEMEIEQAIANIGYSIPADKQADVEKAVQVSISKAFYDCYRKANKNETYDGVNLAEQAPTHPMQVANVIHDYWRNTFWPERRLKIANQLVKKFTLPKTKTSVEH